MCGRASLTKVEQDLEARFRATFYAEDLEEFELLPTFNLAPTHLHPVITDADPEHIQYFRWGLVPFWAKDAAIGSRMINARIESVLEKPAFRQAIRKRRCIVPFDGFYEWQKGPGGKTPFRITLKDEGLFACAGLWEQWAQPDGQTLYTFTVLTQSPNELMAPIHDRMPAILLPEQEKAWLDASLSAEEAVTMIAPYPSEQMKAYPVSRRVNKVSENDPGLIEAVPEEPTQGSLF